MTEMIRRTQIKHVLKSMAFNEEVVVMGWIKAFRNQKFIIINDGSCMNHLQVIVDFSKISENLLKRINVGAAISVKGNLIESGGRGQSIELEALELEIIGDCDSQSFPIQPKKHGLAFLREIAHLRFRTNTFNAIFKVRHALAFAIHQFFNERNFVYLHTPIITASDAEGAGEMFSVSTLDIEHLPKDINGKVDYRLDFFGKRTNLTVSGQLEGELAAMALAEVYTFGPAFRAENSNTTRHLSEFWMVEPEVAFADLEDGMRLAEDMLKYIIKYALCSCRDELDFLNERLQEEEKEKPAAVRNDLSLLDKLTACVNEDFQHITYTQAIEILMASKPNKKGQFQYVVTKWGIDLQSEHERFLVEKHFKKPVIITDYPSDIKSFYMRENEPDSEGRQTVAAMDILFPGIGEIIGGSQREERLEMLINRMDKMNISKEELGWYLDARRFGSVPHTGFGLGFERLVLFVTGMSNIRDVIAFPRYPKNANF